MQAIKTHEQYTIVEGNFMLVASFDLTGENPRITLSKPDSFGGSAKARDYHFELSHLDAVEGFAKCAQKAADLARQLHLANKPKKVKKSTK